MNKPEWMPENIVKYPLPLNQIDEEFIKGIHFGYSEGSKETARTILNYLIANLPLQSLAITEMLVGMLRQLEERK